MAKGKAGCGHALPYSDLLPPGVDHPELTIPGVGQAADEIAARLSSGEKIAVFADYDPDGTCGAAALSLALSSFADQVEWGFADSSEGTGLSPRFVQEAHRAGAGLIVTVDLGSSDPGVLQTASSLGMKVVVSDHHSPHPGVSPDYHLNPSLWGPSEASGAVVAYKLAIALEERLYGQVRPETLERGAFLAAFGARADMMDMASDENKALFAYGDPPPGLRAAAKLLGLKSLSATNCTKIAALLNLPKRSPLAHAQDSAAVLSAEKQQDAEQPLRRLLDVKDRCSQASSSFGSEAARQIGAQGSRRVASATISLPEAHLFPGYAGIVALRMSGASRRPTLIFLPLDEEGSRYKYSLRWTEAPDGKGLLSSVPPLARIAASAGLSPPGGHPRAMGGLCQAGDIDAITEAMEEWARGEGLPSGSLAPAR